MGEQVVMGAMMQCSMGTAPGTLVVLPTNRVLDEMVPAANIMDFAPIVNITTFVMCQSPSNPTVAAATAAAMGVLTPMPCIPVTVAPWSAGCSKVLIGNMPALDKDSTCTCAWGGTISIKKSGTTKTEIG